MRADPYRILRRPLVTEKGTALQQAKSYLFEVDPKANKPQIRAAVEAIYEGKGVKVSQVNTMRVKGKYRRVRVQGGYAQDWKKAIVTLSKGELDTV